MNIHKNARLTPLGRERIVRMAAEGRTPAGIAAVVGISLKTVHKWLARFAAEGVAGLADRSSRPHRFHRPTPDNRIEQIIALRRQKLSGKAIARQVGVSPATVSRVLRRARLSRMRDLAPVEPVRRYERAHPGELIHIDIKKLGRIDGIGHRITGERTGQSSKRGTGWEYLHVAIDDASRLAFIAMMPDEKKESAVAFLDAAIAWFQAHGVTVQRVMTDNGSAYRSKAFAKAIAAHRLKHMRTRPYTPKTNGKAERFIQTSIREWAYASPFSSSADRTRAMHPWLHAYNTIRPHSALKAKPPLSRITRDNVIGNDI